MNFIKPIVVATVTLLNLTACKENKPQITEDKETAQKIDLTTPSVLLAAINKAHGGWNHIQSKKDIEYHYEYTVPEGQADISTERYIFENEISFGHYTRHEINTLPTEKGIVTHLFDGDKTKVTLNGNIIEKERTLAIAEFVRRANYFWLVMPYKLNDPGSIAKYLGTEVHNDISYYKLEVTYDADVTGKEKNDIYILYVNPDTYLIDRFYFSLPFLGINAPVILAEYTYETVEEQKLATNRIYFLPDAEGTYGKSPSITQTLSQITFNNGFTQENIFLVNK